jgi:hypothetical protein
MSFVKTTDGSLVKPIPGFDGYYISRDGVVWSDTRRHGGRVDRKSIPYKKIRLSTNHHGYHVVRINDGKSNPQLRVHRLVLEAYVGPCPKGMQCRHLNGIVDDNRSENLAWGTSHENMIDRAIHYGGAPWNLGSGNGNAKLTENDVIDIREAARSGVSHSEQSRKYGVKVSTISRIVAGVRWKHISI